MNDLKNKEYISDTLIAERALYEETSQKPQNGILRSVKGPLAEYTKPNRNNRVYSEALWDKVLESPYVQEQLKYKTLFGEAGHPTDRYEVDFSRVSHRITSMWKVPATDQIYGQIDILDTPLGQILNTLYEAGGVIGYSSRAGGTLHQKKDHIEVDEATYNFITFDAVPFPSVKAARPDEIVAEGVENKEIASLSDEVHDKLCKIITESGLSNRGSLKDLIYSIEHFDMSKEKALLESMDISKVVEESSSSESTMTLLKESSLKIDDLKASNQVLESDNIALKAENEVLKRSLDESVEKLANAISESKKIEETKAFNRREVNDTIRALESENAELKSRLEDSEVIVEEVGDLRNAVKVLQDENRGLKASMSDVNEGSILKKELDEAYNELSKAVSEIDDSKSEISELNESVANLEKTIKSLRLQLQKSESEVSKLKSDKKELIKESKEFDEELSDSTSLIRQLKSENAKLSSKIKSLEADIANIPESTVQVVENTQYRDDLVSVICSGYNLDPSDVCKHLSEGFTKSDVYCVCEEMNNSKKNGINYKSVVVESLDNSQRTVSNNPQPKAYTAVNRRGIGIV